MSLKTSAKSSALVAAAMAVGISGAMVAPAGAADMEKCYGVAKAGKNDCQTATSSCAGTARMDHQKDAFILVPAGTCDKIAGGNTSPM